MVSLNVSARPIIGKHTLVAAIEIVKKCKAVDIGTLKCILIRNVTMEYDPVALVKTRDIGPSDTSPDRIAL
jgi:hypothetical protein